MKACVDLGGTKITVSLADESRPGNREGGAPVLIARRSEATVKTGASDAIALQIQRMLAEACAAQGISVDALQAIGVSSCGPFLLQDACIALVGPNICGGIAGPARGLPNDWTSAPLEAPLRRRYGERLQLENDGIGALQAERRWGALQGFDHCAYMTWSTGIGFGLCVDGRVLRGKNGNAGHAGHMFVSDWPLVDTLSAEPIPLCGCGNVGDIEGLVSGNAIARRFAHAGYADALALLLAAQSGKDSQAQALVDELCRVLGRALYNLVVTLDLQRISIGGSVFWHNQDYLLPRLQKALTGKIPALTEGCLLVPAGLGEQVGDFGALALVS